MYGILKDSEKLVHMRRQQIDSIKIFNEHVAEVTENSEYKIEFNSNGNLISVVISLSKDFPLEKPVLKVEPIVNHPWVNPTNGEIVAAPGLLKFSIHSELGRVVQAIIREFEFRQPPIIEGYQKEYRQNDNSQDSSTATVSLGSSNGDTTIVSNLNSLNVSQLEKLNNEPEKLDEFIAELPVISNIAKHLDDEMERIENLAMGNLEREEEISSLKTDVNQLTAQLSETFSEYQYLSSEYSKLCEKFNPHSIRESLVHSIHQIDEESEKIAESFLNGDIDLEKFLSDYSSHRFLSHSRKFKAENLGQQLNKLHQSRF